MTETLIDASAPRAAASRPRAIRLLREHSSPGFIASSLTILVVLAWAFWPQAFSPYDPLVGDVSLSFQPPSLAHPFGTDQLGRDLLSRTIHGTSTTLSSTLLAVSIAFVVGTLIGLISGFAGGRVDAIAMRLVDVLLTVPSLLLAMTIVIVLGYGTMNIAIAVGVSSVASFARISRAEVIKIAQSEYIESAYLLGDRPFRVLRRHILPNSLAPVLSLVALEFGTAILAVSALGFLGYGAPPPQPEWGLTVAEGRDVLAVHPWISIIPGIVIALAVLATNRISREIGRAR